MVGFEAGPASSGRTKFAFNRSFGVSGVSSKSSETYVKGLEFKTAAISATVVRSAESERAIPCRVRWNDCFKIPTIRSYTPPCQGENSATRRYAWSNSSVVISSSTSRSMARMTRSVMIKMKRF